MSVRGREGGSECEGGREYSATGLESRFFVLMGTLT